VCVLQSGEGIWQVLLFVMAAAGINLIASYAREFFQRRVSAFVQRQS